MKILLTGGSGMVGKNFIEFCKNKNLILLFPSSSQLNLLDYSQVKQYISLKQPDIVVHAAGIVGGIQDNISNPVKFLNENMEIGKNIIMASYNSKIKRLINLGSSCMYPRDAINPLKEEYILKGELEPTNEGYALAKIMAAKLCEYITKENEGYEYKTIIPCNLYGKYDKFDPKHSHMIPAVIKKIYDAYVAKETKVVIWGDGNSKREFMYAEDLADFIYFSIQNFNKIPQYINVGLGYDYSINEYYNIISKLIGYKGEFIHDLSKPSGMKQKLVDISEATKLGWKPKTNVNDGLKNTIEYYTKS